MQCRSVWFRKEACNHYNVLRCVHDKLSDNKTAYERRFNTQFKAKLIPFGAIVRYLPFRDSRNPNTVMPSVGDRTAPAVFLGYHVHAGGKWSGDYLLVDFTSLTNSRTPAEVPIRRVSEILFNPSKVIFPLADGRLSQPGLDVDNSYSLDKTS